MGNILSTSPTPEYKQLLISWNLTQYANRFKAEGWDDVLDWKSMTDDVLANDIGLSKGHLKRFQRLRSEWLDQNQNDPNNQSIANDDHKHNAHEQQQSTSPNSSSMTSSMTSSPLWETYNRLLAMEFSNNMSLKAAYKYPTNIDDAIKWIMRNQQNQNILNEEDKKVNDQLIDDCKSVESCGAIKRITSMLQFYSSGLTIVQIAACLSSLRDHKDLICDYHHILQVHLNADNSKIANTSEFAMIYKYMIERNKLTCNIEKCAIYSRNNRKREEEKVEVDANTLLYLDLLDCIHCFFIHSVDTGYSIIDNAEYNKQKNKKSAKKKKIHHDEEMESLQSYLAAKRGRLVATRRNTKFVTTITKFTNHDVEECKIPDNNNDLDKLKIAAIKNPGAYSFGYRFNFWDSKSTHTPYYSSMKEELISNKIFCLDLNAFMNGYTKASELINHSNVLKAMKSVKQKVYGIKGNQPLTIKNVLVVVLYTDFDTLSYNFSSTFRSSDDESYEETQKKNREYWHWSKTLIETVNAWGTSVGKSKTQVFYHGISQLYFKGFVASFNSPTSTTVKLQVATIFARNDGIILTLKMHNTYWGKLLRYFNCKFISCFPNEEEMLFIQPANPSACLEFVSIRDMKTNENYEVYIKAIVLLTAIFEGKKTQSNIESTIVEAALDLIENPKQCPQYIVKQFRQWTHTFDDKIKINLKQLKSVLSKEFSNYLLRGPKKAVIPAFDKIGMIFAKTSVIECMQTGRITSAHLSILLLMLKSIKEPLDTIYLLNVDGVYSIKDFKVLQEKYEKQNWEIEIYDEDDLIVNRN